MWLGFFKECIVSLIFLGIHCGKVSVFRVILVQMRENTDQSNSENRHFSRSDELAFSISNFLLLPGKVVICSPIVSHSFILFTIANLDRYFVFIWKWFKDCLDSPHYTAFAGTISNFINDIIFIFCRYLIFWFTKWFM